MQALKSLSQIAHDALLNKDTCVASTLVCLVDATPPLYSPQHSHYIMRIRVVDESLLPWSVDSSTTCSLLLSSQVWIFLIADELETLLRVTPRNKIQLGDMVYLHHFNFAVWGGIQLQSKYVGGYDSIHSLEIENFQDNENFRTKKVLGVGSTQIDLQALSLRIGELRNWMGEHLEKHLLGKSLGCRLVNNYCTLIEPFDLLLKINQVIRETNIQQLLLTDSNSNQFQLDISNFEHLSFLTAEWVLIRQVKQINSNFQLILTPTGNIIHLPSRLTDICRQIANYQAIIHKNSQVHREKKQLQGLTFISCSQTKTLTTGQLFRLQDDYNSALRKESVILASFYLVKGALVKYTGNLRLFHRQYQMIMHEEYIATLPTQVKKEVIEGKKITYAYEGELFLLDEFTQSRRKLLRVRILAIDQRSSFFQTELLEELSRSIGSTSEKEMKAKTLREINKKLQKAIELSSFSSPVSLIVETVSKHQDFVMCLFKWKLEKVQFAFCDAKTEDTLKKDGFDIIQQPSSINVIMGLTSHQYPFVSHTGLKAEVQKRAHFESLFLDSVKCGHQIFIANIFSDEYLRQWGQPNEQQPHQNLPEIDLDQCFIASDMSFTPTQFKHISPLINPYSIDMLGEHKLQFFIKFIIEYCGYLGIKCLTVPFRKGKQKTLCSILNTLDDQLYKAQLGILLHVPLDQESTWDSYISFRQNLHPSISLDLFLEVLENLPPKNVISKWMSEKISFLSFSTDCYQTNQKGVPVLPFSHESLLKNFFKLKAGYVLSLNQSQTEKLNFKPMTYYQYIVHLFQTMVKNVGFYYIQSTERQVSARGLQDILQHPLQPYADNLESETYSIFEFDAPKYEQYAVGILLAFQKLDITNRNIVVYYLGSGRGALIPGIIEASKKTKKKVTIYAIEKNPFPLQTLKRKIKENRWSNIVKIIKSDIKTLQFPENPDIFFSELLGGFGDNQLSPECLKWAEDKIKDKNNLVCLPKRYAAYLKPVCYPSVYRKLKKNQKQSYFTVNFGWHYSPFKSQKAWQFEHPLPKSDQQTLNKESEIKFKIEENITLHGLLGSFDCQLYPGSYFSIVPQNLTIDMFSWFPIYFAFLEEEYVKKGEEILIWIRRINSKTQVWYQWSYRLFDRQGKERKVSQVHNKGGSEKAIYL